jgi:hypothetical protein
MKKNILNNTLFSANRRNFGLVKLIVFFCLVAAFGCKAKKQLVVKKVQPDSPARTVNSKGAKINAIRLAQTNFSSFSGKARTKLNINGDVNDVTLNIRIKRDQKIWVSITAIAGIEVARALITPDSIFLINRLQSLYVRKPFSYVNTLAGKQVNYKTVESLLIGNAIPELITEQADLQTANGNTSISGMLQDFAYKVTVDANLKVDQTSLNNQAAAQSLQVVNSSFSQLGNRLLPAQIDISSMVKDKKILVNLHYIKMDFDQALDFPFSIPSRYSPAR